MPKTSLCILTYALKSRTMRPSQFVIAAQRIGITANQAWAIVHKAGI